MQDPDTFQGFCIKGRLRNENTGEAGIIKPVLFYPFVLLY